MRALWLVLLISGCGGVELEQGHDAGATVPWSEPKPSEGAASLFTVRFIALECALIYCLKADPKVCYCASEDRCMREAADAGWPARGCDAIPLPRMQFELYDIPFGYGAPDGFEP